MVMVTLFCAIVGKERIVPVEIEDDKSVGILKDRITEKEKYSFAASKLTLYKAKQYKWLQNDEEEKQEDDKDDWMKDDDGELVQLQQATIPDDVKIMYLNNITLLKTTWSIEDYFADAPRKNVIHVLVQLPEDGVGVPSGERGSSESIDQVNLPSYPHPHRLERWKKINSILAKNNKKKARTNEEGFTTPYSSSRWTAVGPVFDDDRVKYVEAIRPIPANDLEVLSKVLSWIMKCFEWTLIDVKDNEAKRLHVIAPILWAVVQLLPDVKIYIEEDLDGNRVDAHGHFEFVLMRGNKRVCIVEAKEEKFKQGMAQALLGCEVAADLDQSHEVYAVVTNVEKWIFLKSLDEEILCDEFNALTFDENGSPHEAQLIEVTGKLFSLLA